MKYYRLIGRLAVSCSKEEWVVSDCCGYGVGWTKIGEMVVSTVFLGLNHRFIGDGDPLLFETMINGPEGWRDQERCSTWEQAEAMHDAGVALAQARQDKSEDAVKRLGDIVAQMRSARPAP